MLEHESYSFSRLFLNRHLEFFFIQGINNSENFDEYWDGRTINVIGYAVIYIDPETKKQENFIYLIDNDINNYSNAIKYTRKFIEQMTLSDKLSDRENFKIINTEVYSRVVSEPYKDFIKDVVKNEIPEYILDL
ncbi:hypothetical protein VO178_18380 [Lysinibacillus fusiformis]|uniref:hypothetical protein n=1 Tax=Lysinibacillus fusiformis TaxID=28031 RepID=UPI002D795A86|nr:hypothetical protein [Lysinibacillus fusiformis]WRS97322.1 hypothetical protein VO178_18380 [Lysinibacillus fusiformis]